jgi:hypothetical protein
MQVTLNPEDTKNSMIKKEEIYFAFQEGRIDKEKLLKDLEDIDNIQKNKFLSYLGKGIILLVAVVSPVLLLTKSSD